MTGSHDQSKVPLGYAGPSTPGRPAIWPRVIFWAGTIAFILFAITLLLPALNTGHPISKRVGCASHLRQIGTAMMMYANVHSDAFPDSFATLLRSERDLPPPLDAFICPSSNDTRSAALTIEEQVADLAKPGHLSYIYVAAGLNNMAPSDAILVYEPLSNHRGAGMNVLYGDGHVDWVPAPAAQWAIKEITAGFNPPRAATGTTKPQ